MKPVLFIFLSISLLPVTACLAAQVSEAAERQDSVSRPYCGELEERNKALARRFYEQVWFSRNLSAVDDLVAPMYVVHDIGDRKGITEPADEQKQIADFFWRNGTMTGSIDYQIAQGDLVATRWQWEFQPRTWSAKILIRRIQIPIINVFRFRDGKIVEIWNHRHDIDAGYQTLQFIQGVIVGLLPSLILAVVIFLRRRKRRRQLDAIKPRDLPA